MPSFRKHLRNAASATTHSSCSPCAGRRHRRAETMSPAPMPAAATSSPGPISRTTLVWGAASPAPEYSGLRSCVLNHDRGNDVLPQPRPPEFIADAGIERVFGLPGGEVLVLIDELRTRRRRLRADAARVQRRHCRGGLRQAARPARRGVDDARSGRRQPDAAVEQRVSGSGAAARDLGADPRRVSGQPHASTAAAPRRLPAGREVRREDHRRRRLRRGAARAGGVHGAVRLARPT